MEVQLHTILTSALYRSELIVRQPPHAPAKYSHSPTNDVNHNRHMAYIYIYTAYIYMCVCVCVCVCVCGRVCVTYFYYEILNT